MSLPTDLQNCLDPLLVRKRNNGQLWGELLAYLTDDQTRHAVDYSRYLAGEYAFLPASHLTEEEERAVQNTVDNFIHKFGAPS